MQSKTEKMLFLLVLNPEKITSKCETALTDKYIQMSMQCNKKYCLGLKMMQLRGSIEFLFFISLADLRKHSSSRFPQKCSE